MNAATVQTVPAPHPVSATLARFAALLRFEDIPALVVRRTEDLFADWIGSALAAAQALGRSGAELLCAALVGYEVGIRVGEFLGRSYYKMFHTTGTAGTVAAAAAAGRLLRLSPEAMLHAFGSVGTQAAGLWEFLRDVADSKQLHTAHAAAGLTAACLAADGFTGAHCILEGERGMAAGMSSDADEMRLVDRLGERWALADTTFKSYASCRHTHPAADALLVAMQVNGLRADDLESVVAHVHQAAIDVLGPVVDPQTVHQAKFSMGTVLGLVATKGSASLADFDADWHSPRIAAFRERVRMALDREVDSACPQRWIGKVELRTRDGRTFEARVDEPKGDPGNTFSPQEVDHKAMRLAQYRGGASTDEMREAIRRIRLLSQAPTVGLVFSKKGR